MWSKLAWRLGAVAALSIATAAGGANKGPVADYQADATRIPESISPNVHVHMDAAEIRQKIADDYSSYELVEIQNGQWRGRGGGVGNLRIDLQAGLEVDVSAAKGLARQSGTIINTPTITLREIIEDEGNTRPGKAVSQAVAVNESGNMIKALLSAPASEHSRQWAMFIEYTDVGGDGGVYHGIYCGNIASQNGTFARGERNEHMPPSFAITAPTAPRNPLLSI